MPRESGSRDSDEVLFHRTSRGQVAVMFTGTTDRGAPTDSNYVINIYFFPFRTLEYIYSAKVLIGHL